MVVPCRYVRLGDALQTLSRTRRRDGLPPVLSRDDLQAHVEQDASLARALSVGRKQARDVLRRWPEVWAVSCWLSRHVACCCCTSHCLQARALDFLAGGGAVVIARGARTEDDTVILDPMWLADTLACVITADQDRLAVLPPDLVQRGLLPHDACTLSSVWRDGEGYTPHLRTVLLTLLHHFDLAFELRDAEGKSQGMR